MSERERSYQERRAEEELERAQAATDPAVVAAHYRLAELYLEQVADCLLDDTTSNAADVDTAEPAAGSVRRREADLP